MAKRKSAKPVEKDVRFDVEDESVDPTPEQKTPLSEAPPPSERKIGVDGVYPKSTGKICERCTTKDQIVQFKNIGTKGGPYVYFRCPICHHRYHESRRDFIWNPARYASHVNSRRPESD